jgi:hypothetical protein
MQGPASSPAPQTPLPPSGGWSGAGALGEGFFGASALDPGPQGGEDLDLFPNDHRTHASRADTEAVGFQDSHGLTAGRPQVLLTERLNDRAQRRAGW